MFKRLCCSHRLRHKTSRNQGCARKFHMITSEQTNGSSLFDQSQRNKTESQPAEMRLQFTAEKPAEVLKASLPLCDKPLLGPIKALLSQLNNFLYLWYYQTRLPVYQADSLLCVQSHTLRGFHKSYVHLWARQGQIINGSVELCVDTATPVYRTGLLRTGAGIVSIENTGGL